MMPHMEFPIIEAYNYSLFPPFIYLFLVLVFCFFLRFLFNWRIIALYCCAGFCFTPIQISFKYTYISSLLSLPPTPGSQLSRSSPGTYATQQLPTVFPPFRCHPKYLSGPTGTWNSAGKRNSENHSSKDELTHIACKRITLCKLKTKMK